MSRKHCRRNSAWAERIAASRPFEEADAEKIIIQVNVAHRRLLDGTAEADHFLRLGCAVNIAAVRAEEIDRSLIDILDAAGAALNEGQALHERHGRYGLTGPGIAQLAAGIDAYAAILRASSPMQMEQAQAEVVRRLSMKQATA